MRHFLTGRANAFGHGRRRRPHWGVPPFGLRRRIFWSLVGAMLAAGLFTLALSLFTSTRTGWMAAAFAIGAIGSLWFASGRLAYRLVRPLNRLVDVVQRFGQGDFSARAGFRGRDEVSRVARAVDEMAERIERQMKEERQLLAVVSHELRTPMARIRVLTDLVREGQVSSLNDIDKEVSEIDYLVANLLAHSRLEFGTLSRVAVRLPEAVSEALDRAGLSRVVPDVTGDRSYEPVQADPTLLHSAIANLIDNAQRHGKGVYRVEIRSSNGAVTVEVFDSGPGFGDSRVEERFKAFVAADTSGGRGTGLGLGMNLVQRIVLAHGGRVWAENQDEGGARVGFELPLASQVRLMSTS